MTSPDAEAIAIPEILQNVLLHLDRPSLHACARVSRLWRSWSLHVAWSTYHIPHQDIIDFLARRRIQQSVGSYRGRRREMEECDYEGFPLSQSKKPRYVQEFNNRCFRIQSLTIGAVPSEYSNAYRTQNSGLDWICTLPASLTNLVHLNLLLLSPGPGHPADTLLADIATGLISQNPKLQHLECSSVHQPAYPVWLAALRDNSLQHLRRLEVHCNLDFNGFTELLDLLAMRSVFESPKRNQDQGQESPPQSTMSGWNLEELIVRREGTLSLMHFLRTSRLNSTPPSPVALRRLTLFDFSPVEYLSDGQGEDADGYLSIDESVIYHLCRRFPLLQRLQISPEIAVDYRPSPTDFETYVRNNLRDVDEMESGISWRPEVLAGEIIKACPHLREIDFSHHRQLHAVDWDILLRHYAHQVESLSAWNVDLLEPEGLMRLVPPRPAFIGRAWVGLQDLDISANSSLGSTIPMFLKYVPTLRHLKALSVPVEANQLVGFDWVCTGMETLAINIMVPTQAWPEFEVWRWDVGRDMWDMTGEDDWSMETDDGCGYLAVDVKVPSLPNGRGSRGHGGQQEHSGSDSDSDSDTDSDSDSDSDSDTHSDTETNSSIDSDSDSTSDDSDSDSGSSSHSDSDSASSSDSDVGVEARPGSTSTILQRPGTADAPQPQKRQTYSTQMQIAICQQLGRLTKLKELSLEGRQDFRYDNKEWDCMRLTIKAGLDYLRPLQANLERLVVFQLDDELCGREEMEWLAQNWIHHANPVWQHAFEAWDGPGRMPLEEVDRVDAEREKSKTVQEGKRPVVLCPKFRELIGVSVRGKSVSVTEANMNIAWLEEQCRQLTVERDVVRNQEAFFHGQYQDY